jgi:hypothetical protein
MAKDWNKTIIKTPKGDFEGRAPVIISASRSTDIPAFYSDWFMHRLRSGYVVWINQFNNNRMYISFQQARVIVFWTKNAHPMIQHIPELNDRGMNYYFTHTLNDYQDEKLEPNVPSLKERIETFKILSETVGKEKVIWRFDPLILSKDISVERLVDKIHGIGTQIHKHTEKLVISFIDIHNIKKVERNLKSAGLHDCREFTIDDMHRFAEMLQTVNRGWNLDIATCAETADLSMYGIQHNKCIDDGLLKRLLSGDKSLMDFLGHPGPKGKALKDAGQRKPCGCVPSKDIGQYSTCAHQCVYCYANTSPQIAKENYNKHMASDRDGETIIPASQREIPSGA